MEWEGGEKHSGVVRVRGRGAPIQRAGSLSVRPARAGCTRVCRKKERQRRWGNALFVVVTFLGRGSRWCAAEFPTGRSRGMVFSSAPDANPRCAMGREGGRGAPR